MLLRLILIIPLVMTPVFAEDPIFGLVSNDGKSSITLRGLPTREYQSLKQLQSEELDSALRLYVVESLQDKETTKTIPVMGRTELRGDTVVFVPRFPLVPGQAYVSVYHSPLSDHPVRSPPLRLEKQRESDPEIVGVFPSDSRLPRNLLRLYVHFSKPMQQGDAYQHLEIIQIDGRKLDLPFLEIAEELWDPSGTRLTLLLDPGRIKRGLVPNREVGPIFSIDQDYQLIIKRTWLDLNGTPLKHDYQKRFSITPDFTDRIDPGSWELRAPKNRKSSNPLDASSDDAIHLLFPIPMDHALLTRCIRVRSENGAEIVGDVQVFCSEHQWSFRPAMGWQPGTYRIEIDPILEDIAGNNILRPFEVELRKPPLDPLPTRLQFGVP
jgi:hypothetical protein